MELSKDERAYIKMLESKRDGLNKQLNRLQHEKQIIVDEINRIQNGQMNLDFHQTTIKWEEV